MGKVLRLSGGSSLNQPMLNLVAQLHKSFDNEKVVKRTEKNHRIKKNGVDFMNNSKSGVTWN